MSLGHDLLGQIACARAQLMMRGHGALLVVIGRGAMERLRREAAPYAPHEGLIIDMPYELRDDVEGFLVLDPGNHFGRLYLTGAETDLPPPRS